MDEYDLFELTGLPFDPPEKTVKKVKAVIDSAKDSLGKALSNETQQLKRDEINEKLSFLRMKESEIFTPDEKLRKTYDELAKIRTDKEIKNLKATVNLLKRSGKHVVTNGTIRAQRVKTKLSKENVEKVYNDSGFTITEINPFAAMPKFPTNAEKIYDELAALRKIKDPKPNAPDITKVVDLYAFVAYMQEEPENASEYRSKNNDELVKILDGFSTKLSTRTDNLGKLCQSLATAGKTYVFNSATNRHAYNLHLLYKSPELSELFGILKRAIEADLRDLNFAKKCIRLITEVFGDNDVALAIYNNEANSEAGLKNDPFIPEKASYEVKCAYCQTWTEFEDIPEAQKSNKCSQCGRELYKNCMRCKKPVLASSDKCPECGFVFASAAEFTKYFSKAEEALRRSNFEEAHQYLSKAKSADPGEKTNTIDLAKRIALEEARYEKPINELKESIANNKYQAASEIYARYIGNFPNIATYETKINSALSNAKSEFEKAKKKTISECANACVKILDDICVDFKSAKEFLLSNPPTKCNNVKLKANDKESYVIISWSRNSEHGVTYRVVRKDSKEAPMDKNDGKAYDTNDTSYRDDNLLPGIYYSYSVFAERKGAYSLPAVSESIVLLAKVTNEFAEQTDSGIYITWNKPNNCTGVTVARICNKKESILTESAQTSFVDKEFEYEKTYIYSLKANYKRLPSSASVELPSVTPTVRIDKFQIAATQVLENKYKVTWGISQKEIDIQVFINEKMVRAAKSGKGMCEIDLPAEGLHTVTVKAFSGGNWITSKNSVQINTYSPCEIDKSKTKITKDDPVHGDNLTYNVEITLKIAGEIPKNVTGFCYFIRTKSQISKQAPWAEIDEIKTATDMNKIYIDAYKKKNEILFSGTAKDEEAFYLTFFTLYNINGKEVMSAPYKQRFDREISATVFWKVYKPLKIVGNMKLSVEIKANRPLIRLPKFLLCASPQGQHLKYYTDVNAVILMDIKEQEFGSPQRVIKEDYELNPAMTTRITKNSKLFLFFIPSASNENFTLRWAEGFAGKV